MWLPGLVHRCAFLAGRQRRTPAAEMQLVPLTLCWKTLERACHAVLFEVLDAVSGNGQQGVVTALHELLLDQIPRCELQVLAGSAGHLLEVGDEDPWLFGLDTPACVQNLQYGEPRHLLDRKFILDIGPRTHDAPPILTLAVVTNVVSRSPIRIAEHLVSLRDRAESGVIAGFAVIGMKLLREQAVDTVNGFRLSARADLQVLVIVANLFL
jgi:hypothetical protein